MKAFLTSCALIAIIAAAAAFGLGMIDTSARTAYSTTATRF